MIVIVRKIRESRLYKRIVDNQLKYATIIALTFALIGPIIGELTPTQTVGYILAIIGMLTITFIASLLGEIRSLRLTISDLRTKNYESSVLEEKLGIKHQNEVEIKKKYTDIELKESNDATVTHKYEMKALPGTDREIEYYNTVLSLPDGADVEKFENETFDDIINSVEGAHFEKKERRDYDGGIRYLMTFHMDKVIRPDEISTLSYSFQYPYDIEGDSTGMLIREKDTNEADIKIQFPETWEARQAIARNRREDAYPVKQPKKREKNNRHSIHWNCVNCIYGDRFTIEWSAKKQSGSDREATVTDEAIRPDSTTQQPETASA